MSAVARALGVVALLGLASLLTPVWNWAAASVKSDVRLDRADAIVVLGSSAYADGTLNSGSLRRAIHGITLLNGGMAPRIVFTGAPVSAGVTEAAIREQLARDLRVPAEAVLADDRPRTTREEARVVAERLRPLGAMRILLVTGGGHMGRARRLFEQQGFTVLPAPVNEAPFASIVAEDRFQLARIVIGEVMARTYYRLAGYL